MPCWTRTAPRCASTATARSSTRPTAPSSNSRPARARCAWTAARIDLRAGSDDPRQDGKPRGTLELNAPRLNGARGGIDIEARGPLDIRGARSVAVNGVWVDRSATPAPKPLPAASYQIIDQDYLDRLHDDSRAFITQALASANLVDGKLAGLRPYADALHLRPGIEIRSATPEGDLVVQGDLDLSRYRYASLNPHPADRRLRLGRSRQPGDPRRRRAQIHGSINDGFAPPRT